MYYLSSNSLSIIRSWSARVLIKEILTDKFCLELSFKFFLKQCFEANSKYEWWWTQINPEYLKSRRAPPGGPPTFRLTAESATDCATEAAFRTNRFPLVFVDNFPVTGSVLSVLFVSGCALTETPSTFRVPRNRVRAVVWWKPGQPLPVTDPRAPDCSKDARWLKPSSAGDKYIYSISLR